MPSPSKRGRRGRKKQAVIPPREGGTTMTEKEKNHSPTSRFSGDLYASWPTGMKQMITSYIDTSEKLANGMLSFHEKATDWAKDTTWAPFLRAKRYLAGKVIEG